MGPFAGQQSLRATVQAPCFINIRRAVRLRVHAVHPVPNLDASGAAHIWLARADAMQ